MYTYIHTYDTCIQINTTDPKMTMRKDRSWSTWLHQRERERERLSCSTRLAKLN